MRFRIFRSNMIGTKLTHYEITSHIGSGGMGDVFQGTDTKLGRSVAIKFLPEAFSHDAEGVARFQREARVLASLNHSNIAAIHGLEEINGRHFLMSLRSSTLSWLRMENRVQFSYAFWDSVNTLKKTAVQPMLQAKEP